MDLGKCPRCGAEWTPGDEICPHCGFIPIGAGLRSAATPGDNERSAARERSIELDLGIEREPGSRPGLILSALLLIVLAFAYDAKVWTNEWQPLRVAFGAQPSPEITGDWGITVSEELDREGIAAKVQGLAGSFQFGKNGTARIHLYRGFDEMEATGQFSQSGNSIQLKHLEGTNGGSQLPSQVNLNVVWRHGDQMQVDIEGQERVTLMRQS